MSFVNKLLEISFLIFPDLKWFYKFRQANSEALTNAGIIEKLWAFRKGFFLETITLCGITKENYREYLSDKAYLKLHPINKQYTSIIDNKLYLPFLLKDYPELVPRYFFVIDHGRLVKLDQEISANMSLFDLCKEKRKLVLKPCSDTYGRGFFLMEWKEGYLYINNKGIEIAELDSFIKSLDKYLITEYIIQNKYSAEINCSSVNTIRLLCVRDKDNFYIAKTFHRFGWQGRLVDNIGSEGGGILAFIDIPTGRLKDISISRKKGEVGGVVTKEQHPDSKAQIAGVQIPGWTDMTTKVLAVLNHLSFLKYAGLDIVMTVNGFKILEINSLPSLPLLQIGEGLLKNDRLKKFYLHQ